MARRGYSNVASPLTVVGGLNSSDTSTVITLSATPSGFPAAPYFAVIDLGTASEEVVYVTASVGTTVTATRGSSLSTTYGSATKTHSNGATFRHVAAAADYDEANAHLSDVSRDDHTQYAKRGQGLAAAVGAASRAGRFYYKTDSDLLTVDDGAALHDFPSKAVTDAAYASITAELAWTAYTPVVGGVTLGNGSVVGAYRKTGKTLHVRMVLSLGTTSSVTGAITLSLPVSLNTASTQVVPAIMYTGGASYIGVFSINGGTITGNLVSPTSATSTVAVNADATHPAAWSSGGNVVVTGTLEIA